MRLFIAEKPQLAKVIAEALGNAKWRKADLPLKLRPAKYQPIERTAAQFAVSLCQHRQRRLHWQASQRNCQ